MSIFTRLLGRGAEPAEPRLEPVIATPSPVEVYDDETKASAVGALISEQVLGRPVWSERTDYERMANEGYRINPISFRCVKLIATAMASADLLLQQRGRGKAKELTDHPILDLLARPNPMQGGDALFASLYSFWLLKGDGYLEGVGPKSQGEQFNELWTHRPDRIKPVAGPFGMPQAYEFRNTGAVKTWPVSRLNGRCNLLHLREFHPLDDWYGLSRMEPAARGIDRNNAAAEHNMALLQNGARPSGALVFEPVVNGGQISAASPEVIAAAEKRLLREHGGPKRAGRPMVVSGNVRWEEMGLSPKDMDFAENKRDSARDICLAWGVPPVLVVDGQSTFNNVREAKLELWEQTIIPLLEHALGDLNNWLCPRWGDGLFLLPDYDNVSALEPRRTARRDSITDLIEKGILDADEGREMLDYAPRKAGTLRKVDPSTVTALLNAVQTLGIGPIAKYMRSVGLIDESMTDEQIAQAAADLIESDDDETDDLDDDGNPIDGDAEDENEDDDDAE